MALIENATFIQFICERRFVNKQANKCAFWLVCSAFLLNLFHPYRHVLTERSVHVCSMLFNTMLFTANVIDGILFSCVFFIGSNVCFDWFYLVENIKSFIKFTWIICVLGLAAEQNHWTWFSCLLVSCKLIENWNIYHLFTRFWFDCIFFRNFSIEYFIANLTDANLRFSSPISNFNPNAKLKWE